MKAKKIKVVKNWPKPKSVQDIQIFLRFANFYQQFIQSFSRIAALFTSMLKMTGSSDELVFGRNNGSKSASSRNNNSRPVSGKNDGNNKVVGFGVNNGGGNAFRKNNSNDEVVRFGISGGINKLLNQKID